MPLPAPAKDNVLLKHASLRSCYLLRKQPRR